MEVDTPWVVWQWQSHFRGQFIMISAVTVGSFIQTAFGAWKGEQLAEKVLVSMTSALMLGSFWLAGRARDKDRAHARAICAAGAVSLCLFTSLFASMELGQWDTFCAGRGLQADASVGLTKLITVWGNMMISTFISAYMFHVNAVHPTFYMVNVALILTIGAAAADAAQAEQLRLDPKSITLSSMKSNICAVCLLIGPALYAGAWRYAHQAYEQELCVRKLTAKEKSTMRNLMAITFHELRKCAHRCVSRRHP